MNENTKNILLAIEEYSNKYPEQRFTQVLFNIGITEFADENSPKAKGELLREIYFDTDIDVWQRIKTRNKE
jgi:hypothetical protein